MNQDTKQYQMIAVFPPTLNPEELKKNIEKVKEIITAYQGAILDSAEPQLKRLSYPINKYEEAFYSTINFSLSPESMEEINKQLNLEDNLIRHVITTYQESKAKSEPAMDYSKMVEKIEPIKKEPVKEPEPEKEKPKEKKPVKKTPKAEIEDLDKKLEEILSE